MMVLRLALNEIGKFSGRKLTRLAIAALLIIPLLYSSLYLYANSDPYTNLKNVPVAIVNNDTGKIKADAVDGVASQSSEKTLKNMGAELVKKLKENGTFKWETAKADDVRQKVINGDYAFALIIGEDFTDNINKLAKFDAVKTGMTLLLNDANSYVLHEIAEQLEFRVTSEVASEISKQVIILQLDGLAEIRSDLEKAAAGASELSDGLKTAQDGAKELDAGVSEFADALLELKQGIDKLNASVKALPAALDQLKDGSEQLKTGLDQVNSITQEVDAYEVKANEIWRDIIADLKALIDNSDLPEFIKDDFLTVIDDADDRIEAVHLDISQYVDGIDKLDSGAGALDAGIGQLQDANAQLLSGIQQLDDGVNELQSNFGKIVTGVAELSSGLKKLTDGATTLETGLKSGADKIPDLSEKKREEFAGVVTSPVKFKTTTIAAAHSYAIGLAPFFMALAGWIGVYILFVLMAPISTRALISNVAPWKVALGGWLTPAAIGVLQMLIMFVALRFIVDLNPVYTLLTVLFLILMVLTYLTIVHFLITALGKVGLFIGLVLMIVQLTTSGGTFPWQTMPVIDQALHQVLPMSHAVDALRNLIYGGSLDIALQRSLFLLAYFVVFAVLDIVIVRIRRRWTMKTLFPAI
jgi:putative membrane protein